MLDHSGSANVNERIKAEKELNGLYHSANSFGKLVRNIRRYGYNLIYPVALRDDGGMVDGSHRLVATQFLMDKGLLPLGSFFSFVKVHYEKTIPHSSSEERRDL
jgi:hypothetical protein